MRHGVKTKKLGRDAGHRKAMLKNLATSILAKGMADEQAKRSVVTTVQKAKAVRSLVERLITYGKKADLSARRQAARFVKESDVLKGLFDTIAPRYAERVGGYTRVLKLSENRLGDNAQMAIITLVEDSVVQKPKKKPVKAKSKASKSPKVDITKSEEPAAAQAETVANEEPSKEAGLTAPSQASGQASQGA